ncbi:MAG: hypothetical protein ACI9MS_003239 [Glaciecola sp.]|jgi:hypothetical protein
MFAFDQQSHICHRLFKLPTALLALTLSTSVFATEGGFLGVYTGVSSSLDADKTSSTFKILVGAHVTSRISLEFGYVNFGATRYDDPTAINTDDSDLIISFEDADHGSISAGQLGVATVVAGGRDTYDNKGASSFSGVNEFTPEGALVNLRYRFPILDNLNFFVKTGFFAWAADYKTTKITADKDGVITQINEEDSQTSAVNAISGGGFIYSPIPELSFRAELETTAISSGVMPRTRLQNISIGANWEF